MPRPSQRPIIAADALAKTYRLKSARGGITWNRRFGIPLPRPAGRVVHAVDGVTFDIGPGEILGLVGESGSGKSTLARLMLRLIQPSGGTVRYEDSDIAGLRGPALRQFRQRAQIVFQNPDSSLNPRWTVGRAVGRAIRLHRQLPRDVEHAEVDRLLQRVGLRPEFRDRYPHQLSGGEKQRVGIARALATDPRFLVCDEPVSALDISVQATVLNLLADLRDEYGLSYLFISHDLAVVAHIASRIAVMFAGHIVEIGSKLTVLNPPYHPYTEALLSAAPWANHDQRVPRVLIHADEGTARTGCPFRLRCPRKFGPICDTETPPLRRGHGHHVIACHIPLDELARVPSVETASHDG